MYLCCDCWLDLFADKEENDFVVEFNKSTNFVDLYEDDEILVREIPGQCQRCGSGKVILGGLFLAITLFSKPVKPSTQRKKMLHQKKKKCRKMTRSEYVSLKNAVEILAFHRRSINEAGEKEEPEVNERPQKNVCKRRIIPNSFFEILEKQEKVKCEREDPEII